MVCKIEEKYTSVFLHSTAFFVYSRDANLRLTFKKEKYFTLPQLKMCKVHILWKQVLHQPDSESEIFKIQTFVTFPTI